MLKEKERERETRKEKRKKKETKKRKERKGLFLEAFALKGSDFCIYMKI